MTVYRLWFIKRDKEITGPFPEPVICQQIVMGRIHESDLLSLDRHAWHSYQNVPEIFQEIERLLAVNGDSDDQQWRQERVQAALRHLDERKRPDRRSHETAAEKQAWQGRREGYERRQPESFEQYDYRQAIANVDNWLRQYRLRNGWAALLLLMAAILIGLALHRFQAVTPIDIGLAPKASCDQPAKRGVDWHECDKTGYLLAGADLRQAKLEGTNLAGANLSYADLSRADLRKAHLLGAKMAGAILDGATWVDGHICAANSIGTCN